MFLVYGKFLLRWWLVVQSKPSQSASTPPSDMHTLGKPTGLLGANTGYCHRPEATGGYHQPNERRTTMPKYVIERDLPGAGKLSLEELKAISQKSCDVLRNLGPKINWVQSFVTDDKI